MWRTDSRLGFGSIISEASTTAIGFERLISVPCRDWKITVLLA